MIMKLPNPSTVNEAVDKTLNFCGEFIKPLFEDCADDEIGVDPYICATLDTAIEHIRRGNVKWVNPNEGKEEKPKQKPGKKISDTSDSKAIQEACFALADSFVDNLAEFAETEEAAKEIVRRFIPALAASFGVEERTISDMLGFMAFKAGQK